MCKDEFRRFQKMMCPSNMSGKKTGKRAIYGCPCCMGASINHFKKVARKKARSWLKELTRREINEE